MPTPKFEEDYLEEIILALAGELKTIDKAHNEIHEGEHFMCTDIDTSITSPKYWSIEVGAKEMHMVSSGDLGDTGFLHLTESPTISTVGTTLASFNNNRNSTILPTVNITKDPTVSDNGTTIASWMIGGSAANPTASLGGEARNDAEIELAINTTYLVEWRPDQNDGSICIRISWYEEDV